MSLRRRLRCCCFLLDINTSYGITTQREISALLGTLLRLETDLIFFLPVTLFPDIAEELGEIPNILPTINIFAA